MSKYLTLAMLPIRYRRLRALAPSLVFALFLPGAAQNLPGTQPLTIQGDFADQMLSGMDAYLLRELAASPERRPGMWKGDFSSRDAYDKSIAPNRRRFRKIIGLEDERIPFQAPALEATLTRPAALGTGSGYDILQVRWPVLPGVDGVGLLLTPKGPIAAAVVALPDADWTPEMLAGLEPGVPPAAQFARRLAENGCQVLIPV